MGRASGAPATILIHGRCPITSPPACPRWPGPWASTPRTSRSRPRSFPRSTAHSMRTPRAGRPSSSSSALTIRFTAAGSVRDRALTSGGSMARLTPITNKSQVAAKEHPSGERIVKSRAALQGPFTMFLHCPELAERVAHLGAFVRFEGSLDMRVRVLAAMAVARELDAVYVWGAQTGGARKLGVPETTITAIREKHTRGLPPEGAQIVEVTQQLLRKHRVDEATVKALRQRFGDDGFIQLTGAIGYYSMLAMTVNACELEAAPGAEVLKA